MTQLFHMEQLGFDRMGGHCGLGGVAGVGGGYVLNWADYWVGIHWGTDWSDTQCVPTGSFPSQNIPSEPGTAGAGGQLFHVEQLGDGVPGADSDLGGEVDRLVGLATDLGDKLDDRNLVELRARMFAHEVNNLVMSISGRAQRGLISGDPGHVSAALNMAAEVGGRVASLCEIFMSEAGDPGGDCKSDNLSCKEGLGLANMALCDTETLAPKRLTGRLGVTEVLVAHRFALDCVGGHPVLIGGMGNGAWAMGNRGGEEKARLRRTPQDGESGHPAHGFAVDCVGGHRVMVGGGVEFMVEIEGGDFGDSLEGGVPMTGMLLGQVLVNLYGNALDGIERKKEQEALTPALSPPPNGVIQEEISGGVIRLSVRGLGDGVELVVEDSGCGFGGGKSAGGHGLGLGVCRAIVGGYGGRVFVGESEDLLGGRVSVVFERPA